MNLELKMMQMKKLIETAVKIEADISIWKAKIRERQEVVDKAKEKLEEIHQEIAQRNERKSRERIEKREMTLLVKHLRGHPKVSNIADDRDSGGEVTVWLEDGWMVDGLHSIVGYSTAELRDEMKKIEKCNCGECSKRK